MSAIKRPADGYHVVQQGEWVSKIAAQYGIPDWREIWDHAKNSDLRQKRQEPNVLFKGDRLFIPELQMGHEERPTNKKHRFILETSKKKLKLVLRDWEDKPRKGIPCVLEINGQVSGKSVTTDPDGKLEFEIPEDVRGARLLVGQNRSEVYEVLVGHLDPVDEVTGYQQRLSNLGHKLGKIDGVDGPLTKSAVRSFQHRENFLAGSEVLKVDGIMGPKTKDKLQQRHGY
jgi:N-acetylmuramoyl-L-alanine amidase